VSDETPVEGAVALRLGRSSLVGTSVEKVMRLIEALAVPGAPHRLVDLAERDRLSPFTTYRLVSMPGAGLYCVRRVGALRGWQPVERPGRADSLVNLEPCGRCLGRAEGAR
jgi:hypothetical protein